MHFIYLYCNFIDTVALPGVSGVTNFSYGSIIPSMQGIGIARSLWNKRDVRRIGVAAAAAAAAAV